MTKCLAVKCQISIVFFFFVFFPSYLNGSRDLLCLVERLAKKKKYIYFIYNVHIVYTYKKNIIAFFLLANANTKKVHAFFFFKIFFFFSFDKRQNKTEKKKKKKST